MATHPKPKNGHRITQLKWTEGGRVEQFQFFNFIWQGTINMSVYPITINGLTYNIECVR